MLPCVMIGDSLAVGVGQARPECETVAQVGINSDRYIATMLPGATIPATTAVISLGVNDDESLDTLANLQAVRRRVSSPQVVWLLPGLKDRVRAMIRVVAAEHGDRLVDTRPYVGRDGLHPNGAGYEVLATQAVGEGDVEVASYAAPRVQLVRDDPPRRLRALATPRERIHRLKQLRQAEGPVRGSHKGLARDLAKGPVRVQHVQRDTQKIVRVTARTTAPVLAPGRAAARMTMACGQPGRPCGAKPRAVRG